MCHLAMNQLSIALRVFLVLSDALGSSWIVQWLVVASHHRLKVRFHLGRIRNEGCLVSSPRFSTRLRLVYVLLLVDRLSKRGSWKSQLDITAIDEGGSWYAARITQLLTSDFSCFAAPESYRFVYGV